MSSHSYTRSKQESHTQLLQKNQSHGVEVLLEALCVAAGGSMNLHSALTRGLALHLAHTGTFTCPVSEAACFG